MNIMEEIFEIRSCIEILANDIKIDSRHNWSVYVLQLIKNYKVYILVDLHPLTVTGELNIFFFFLCGMHH